MRLLFLTNLYPPNGSGGYEQWCQEVAGGMRERGHQVEVLTSRNGVDRIQVPEPSWVHRTLHMEMEFASLANGLRFFTDREAHEAENLNCLRDLLNCLQPDLLVVWGMWNLSWSLPALAEALLPGRVVYYFADYWPSLPSQHEFYWQAPARSWATRLPKSLLRPVARRLMRRQERPALRFANAIFPSHFMAEEYHRLGISAEQVDVIFGAIDTQPFWPRQDQQSQPGQMPLALLYAGRLSPEKGIETAIEAISILIKNGNQVRLSVVGGGESGYVQQLQERVQAAGLKDAIRFLGPVAKEEMPPLYRQFDAFLFPSVWQEPFGRVLVEAMASGLVVIGTATGGAGEILQDEETALVFAPGDAAGLAKQIMRVQQPGLRWRIAQNGRRAALEKFDMGRMITEIEALLNTILARVA